MAEKSPTYRLILVSDPRLVSSASPSGSLTLGFVLNVRVGEAAAHLVSIFLSVNV